MARTKREWTQAKFERYQKEGCGQGTGKYYGDLRGTLRFAPSEGGAARSLSPYLL
jgi:hypothetical protein